ncbi:MAG TPA: hypothetical protein QGH10_06525 [Armatimonadota bacterium]|nr:hypothetical protein [Armatimonadota bacterium]
MGSIPFLEFAKAMLERDPGFARRVASFEERFGPVSDDMLAVLAQAAYLCWGNLEYRENLREVCRAIGSGEPTSLRYHRQITPERWRELHGYLVGGCAWLGNPRPIPAEVDADMVALVGEWLSEPTPAKVALTKLFAANLTEQVTQLRRGNLGEERESIAWGDFSAWHEHPPTADIEHSALTACAAETGRESASELVEGITQLSPPPCVHRYARYLEIRLTSIGALKWRGALPPDCAPVADWQAMLADVSAECEAWATGQPVGGPLGEEIRPLLGEPTESKVAVVRDFLLSENRGDEAAWHWLEEAR